MNWDNVKEIVGKSAPLVGTLLGGPVGGSVGTLISQVLGVNNNPDSIELELRTNPDAILKLKEMEITHAEKLEELKLEAERIEAEKYKKAHDTYQAKSTMADRIAEQIIKYNLPVITLLVAINVVIVHYFKDDASLIAIVSNIIGLAIGKLFTERQAVINFFFGSSIGSKEKDEYIKGLK